MYYNLVPLKIIIQTGPCSSPDVLPSKLEQQLDNSLYLSEITNNLRPDQWRQLKYDCIHLRQTKAAYNTSCCAWEEDNCMCIYVRVLLLCKW